MGRFVSQGAGAARLWPALGVPAVDQSLETFETWLADGGENEIEETFGAGTVAAMRAEFRQQVEGEVRPEEAETRLDLAIAYREMGLVAHALREAALALQLEARLTREQALDALGFLLDQRHLRVGVDVIVALREALFAN